eukprot:TRINITY_DN2144_c0_g1_i1.p1 TRINITY_DN2144_c0_g1~~TRINITY_DN2144_c0_g1_i1.p1  ORF type:complete len:171 (-),score=35.89 TRINITY_DN2144_c0_g1_i1:477-989(-)
MRKHTVTLLSRPPAVHHGAVSNALSPIGMGFDILLAASVLVDSNDSGLLLPQRRSWNDMTPDDDLYHCDADEGQHHKKARCGYAVDTALEDQDDYNDADESMLCDEDRCCHHSDLVDSSNGLLTNSFSSSSPQQSPQRRFQLASECEEENLRVFVMRKRFLERRSRLQSQ